MLSARRVGTGGRRTDDFAVLHRHQVTQVSKVSCGSLIDRGSEDNMTSLQGSSIVSEIERVKKKG